MHTCAYTFTLRVKARIRPVTYLYNSGGSRNCGVGGPVARKARHDFGHIHFFYA